MSEKRITTCDNSPEWGTLLLQSLDERWEIYRSALRRSRKRCTEKTVHDLRVATRRLISTFDLLASVAPEENLAGVRRYLRRRLKLLNPLRDLQVQQLYIERMAKEFPAASTFLTLLRLRERKAIKLFSQRQDKQTAKLETAIVRAKTAFISLLNTPPMENAGRSALLGAVAAAFSRVAMLRLRIDAGDRRTIHSMRVAFKKFRYMTEALQPVLHDVTKETLRQMNAFQDAMGAIQDLEVLTSALRAFAQRSSPELRRSLRRVQHELQRQHDELVNKFVASADDVYGFWKHADAGISISPSTHVPHGKSIDGGGVPRRRRTSKTSRG